MKRPKSRVQMNEGNLVVMIDRRPHKGPIVTIYGDPVGLRYLANTLLRIANTDQDSLSRWRLPDGEGLHVDLHVGHDLNPESDPVIAGRLDAKKTHTFDWFYPPVEPKPKKRRTRRLRRG